MRLAASHQHAILRKLCHISPTDLPSAPPGTSSLTSVVAYILHLTTDCGGAALANPELSLTPAHCGATISVQPLLRVNPFHAAIACDPTSWPSCGIPHFVEGAAGLATLHTCPAFFSDPPRYPDRHRAYRAAVAPNGTFDIACVDAATNLHPQSCMTKFQNLQILADILTDKTQTDYRRASLRAGTAFNANRALVPAYVSINNTLSSDEYRTLFQHILGVGLTFIGSATRCLRVCPTYGPRADYTVPGSFGKYYVTLDWHRAGCHQLSCRIGYNVKARHEHALTAVMEGFSKAGAAVDKSEIFISPHDGKRADGILFHPCFGTRGLAIDATVWNDYTLPRLSLSAAISHWVLLAAETFKTAKYEALADAVNLDFACLAFSPRGGFGPHLERLWHAIWADRVAHAVAAGQPTRPILSLERRCLEHVAQVFARCLHSSTYSHTTDRTIGDRTQPADDDEPTTQLPRSL